VVRRLHEPFYRLIIRVVSVRPVVWIDDLALLSLGDIHYPQNILNA